MTAPSAPPVRLIVNCDDFGSSLAANEGVEAALTRGIATSATLMVPCPWAYDAMLRARHHAEWGIGVHLTHTAEWSRYRWRPLLPRDRVPGLYGPDGFMWPSAAEVWANATPQEALAESAAQIEQAMAWGLQPTHIDTHMGVLQFHQAFCAVYLELAEWFHLPLRMPGERRIAEALARFPWAKNLRERAQARGIPLADEMVYGTVHAMESDARQHVLEALAGLRPGTTEMLFHPAEDGHDLAAVIPSGGRDRVRDLQLLTADADVRRVIAERGIELVDFRALGSA